MKSSGQTGVTLERGAPGFDAAVLGTSFNAREPGRRPAVVVQANDVLDVIAAVRRAGREGRKVSICSGGHSWAQNHIREDGLLIDVSRLNAITVDSVARTATVGPGAHCGDVDTAVKNADLFFPVAHAWTVGIGGFLLQGGFGWNSRARTSPASTWSSLTGGWCTPARARTPICSGPRADPAPASSASSSAFTSGCTPGRNTSG
ncbi:MAG: FAD-binding oxidoreductase [Caulobacter sp.]